MHIALPWYTINAACPLQVFSGEYSVSSDILNAARSRGVDYGHVGFMYNVWDLANYDFFYVR